MSNDRKRQLLEKIRGMRPKASSEEAEESVTQEPAAEEARRPTMQPIPEEEQSAELENMLSKLQEITEEVSQVAEPEEETQAEAQQASPPPVAPQGDSPKEFNPTEPESLGATGLTTSKVEELIVKYLLARGEDSGQGISEQLKLPFNIITEILFGLKKDQLIHYRDTANLNDYVISLTDLGRDRARRFSLRCTYYGAAPVPLRDYISSVTAQSLAHQKPAKEDLQRAFSDLLINEKMFTKLGAACNSGRGMFLFGYPGNGKTSIAERITKAFGETIWIPRAIGVDGEIIRLFDPSQHDEMPVEKSEDIYQEIKYDQRWVRIRRPTIIVGGELTMANLELCINEATGINEAPIQLKSNCGTLVIDDFGRQRMTTDELLNRWIVPLEKRYDFLNLPSGKKIQVPFDQLVVFSTNLEPKDLVDDAFLRRIPYKIEVENPSEHEFRELFKIMCPLFGFKYSDRAVDYLLQKHYQPNNRPLRCCHPRDLLLQVKNLNQYQRDEMVLTPKNLDFACDNYFSIV